MSTFPFNFRVLRTAPAPLLHLSLSKMATTTTTTPDAPTKSPAEIFAEYIEKHRVKERLEEAMNVGVQGMPEDPLAAIAAALMAAAPSAATTPAAAAPEATGEELVKLADTMRENMELNFDPKDHTEAEVLQVVADAKRVVECGTALAAKVKAAGGGKKVEADAKAMWEAA